MADMQLGAYVFAWKPEELDTLEKEKSYSVLRTWTTAAFFSWGTSRIGKEIELDWDWMPEAQWNQLQTLLEADVETTWWPEVGGTSYTVEVVKLAGKFVQKSLLDAPYRRQVRLTLVMKS